MKNDEVIFLSKDKNDEMAVFSTDGKSIKKLSSTRTDFEEEIKDAEYLEEKIKSLEERIIRIEEYIDYLQSYTLDRNQMDKIEFEEIKDSQYLLV